jgi:hypothetical protein
VDLVRGGPPRDGPGLGGATSEIGSRKPIAWAGSFVPPLIYSIKGLRYVAKGSIFGPAAALASLCKVSAASQAPLLSIDTLNIWTSPV